MCQKCTKCVRSVQNAFRGYKICQSVYTPSCTKCVQRVQNVLEVYKMRSEGTKCVRSVQNVLEVYKMRSEGTKYVRVYTKLYKMCQKCTKCVQRVQNMYKMRSECTPSCQKCTKCIRGVQGCTRCTPSCQSVWRAGLYIKFVQNYGAVLVQSRVGIKVHKDTGGSCTKLIWLANVTEIKPALQLNKMRTKCIVLYYALRGLYKCMLECTVLYYALRGCTPSCTKLIRLANVTEIRPALQSTDGELSDNIVSYDDYFLFPVLHDYAEKQSCLFISVTDMYPLGCTVYLPVPFSLILLVLL